MSKKNLVTKDCEGKGTHKMVTSELYQRIELSAYDRMMVYAWHDVTRLFETKFGDTFVKAGEDPEACVMFRIRDSVGVLKTKCDNGDYVLDKFWDVSNWASKVDKNHVGAHMDDYIRRDISCHTAKSDLHKLAPSELIVEVDNLIDMQGQPRQNVGLSPWQYNATTDVLMEISNGKRTILAELCPRFGKTIWAAAMSVEVEIRLTIIASYVLSSFTSFKQDLGTYEQFKHLVLVDASESGWEDKVNNAIYDGMNVVVFLSMCNSIKLNAKVQYLFNLDVSRMLIIDEADLGAHKKNQSDKFIDMRKKDDIVILMTGTRGDRASSRWPIDYYYSVGYNELFEY